MYLGSRPDSGYIVSFTISKVVDSDIVSSLFAKKL